MERPITFVNGGQQIVGILHIPSTNDPVPGVVLCHGFTGNKAESHFVFTKLARALCDAGIAALRFDFRGSGDSEGTFEEMTVSGEIGDALIALDELAAQPFVDNEALGIMGLSLGGCVAASAAGRSHRVKSTVLWAPVHDPAPIFTRRAEPGTEFPLEFSGGMLLGKCFADDVHNVKPLKEIRDTSGPVLVLHGDNDETLPVEGSEAYVTALEGTGIPCMREVIPGGDHTFASVAHEKIVIERTVAWFSEHLKARKAAPRAITYADAGVDVDLANETKKHLKELVRDTYTPQVLTELGAFGGLFDGEFPDIAEPVLVGSTDGVGTKLKVAVMSGKHDTVGMDIINHCINDILVMGAKPLFFMDYVALGKHETQMVVDIVKGLSTACSATGCALLGGETAEMPDMYAEGEYDLAGTIVGIVDKGRIIDGSAISVGDVILGLGSDGLHTNGYSLARKLCFEVAGWAADTTVPEWSNTVAAELLTPHRCYLNPLWPLLEDGLVHGLAHITGGGLTDNVPRVLPEGTAARIQRGTWSAPAIFDTLVRLGNLDIDEAYHAFNMGVGMTVIVAADQVADVTQRLTEAGERVSTIGEIVAATGEEDRTVIYA